MEAPPFGMGLKDVFAGTPSLIDFWRGPCDTYNKLSKVFAFTSTMSRNVNIYKSSNGRQYVRVSESYRNADDDMLAAFGLKPLCRLEEKASLRRKLRLKTFPPMA